MDEQNPNDRNKLIDFIAATIETMRGQMVTKDDVRALERRMATKDDLRRLEDSVATKDDLRRLEELLEGKMDGGFTAVMGDIERLALRLDQVDRRESLRSTAIEMDMSRLRSVVYLLVKDQPDLVRMLGS